MSKQADGVYRDNNSWETPWWLVCAVAKRMGFEEFDLDPAATWRTSKGRRYFDETQDGLAQDWHGRVFLNPPWGKYEAKCKVNCSKKVCERRGHHLLKDFPGIGAWAEKMVAESRAGLVDLAVGVMPSNNSDAAWFHQLVPACSRLIFLRGRVPFELDGVPMRNNAVACSLFVVEPVKRNPNGLGPRPEFWSVAELQEENSMRR